MASAPCSISRRSSANPVQPTFVSISALELARAANNWLCRKLPDALTTVPTMICDLHVVCSVFMAGALQQHCQQVPLPHGLHCRRWADLQQQRHPDPHAGASAAMANSTWAWCCARPHEHPTSPARALTSSLPFTGLRGSHILSACCWLQLILSLVVG